MGEPPVDVPPEEEEPPIDNPPEDTPKPADPNEYQVAGRDGGTNSGEGSFIPTGPGIFTAPPQVEQVLPDSPAPDRGPNIATPGPESSSRTPGSETGVSAGRDDADSGVAGGPVNDRSGADADNKPKNGKVSGPAA